MGRSRSRDRGRERSRDRRRDSRSRSPAGRDRQRRRDSSRERRRDGSRERRRDGSRERRRDGSRERRRDGSRERRRSSSPERRKDSGPAARSRSPTRPRSSVAPAAVPVVPQDSAPPHTAAHPAPTPTLARQASPAPAAPVSPPAPPTAALPAAPRLGALAALKAKLAAGGAAAAAAAAAAAGSSSAPNAEPATAPVAWAPWEDASLVGGSDGAAVPDAPRAASPPPASAPRARATAPVAVPMYPELEKPSPHAPYVVPLAVVIKRAKADAEEMRDKMKAARGVDDDEVDPLDAFMSDTVLPEVKQRAEEAAKLKDDERIRLAELLKSGVPIKPLKVLEDLSEEDEETPDLEIWVPTNKIKLIVGAGGLTIGAIQKKSKARVQIVKTEVMLTRAFGSGPAPIELPVRRGAAPKAKPAICAAEGSETKDGAVATAGSAAAAPVEEKKMTKVQLFGDAKSLEIAERMIWEAVDNKEQKAKQREKEYEKKREAKSEKRMLYHLRHSNDYEVLGLQIGASRAEIKKAYKTLALKWHPDKHRGGDVEEAVAKFQAVQRAYDALTTTSEDDTIQSLTGAAGAAAAKAART